MHALEYRGYDSAGIAYFTEEGKLATVKAKGKIVNVEEKIRNIPNISSDCVIGHTRWATHGAPSDENSHPHGTHRVQLVHNGIIENYASLKSQLETEGYRFESATDTEVAAKLIDRYYRLTGDPVATLRKAEKDLRGSYAFGVIFADHPGNIYALRKESPLLIGHGENGNFIASDVTAFLADTNRYYRLEAGEIAIISKEKITFLDINNSSIEKAEEVASWDVQTAERGGYKTFMEKEIREEPEALRKTLSPRIREGLPDFSEERLDDDRLRNTRRIHVVACGTAYHAGYFAKYFLEQHARIPTEICIASEFRYQNPILSPDDTVIVISQSGETADTLAALRLAKAAGAYIVSVVNVVGSTIARESDTVLTTLAGPEIAVASTKAYTVQTGLLFLLAVKLSLLHHTLTEEEARRMVHSLAEELPALLEMLLQDTDNIAEVASELVSADSLFFIGRNLDYVSSLEGSLKLKEISYIHSEAYAAGELKHGTISLIEPGMPVIAITTVSALREKMLSNVKEVLARGATVYTLCPASAEQEVSPLSRKVLRLPECDEILLPILSATVLQLLAYYTATFRNCNVDQPRNLAKSVTVE